MTHRTQIKLHLTGKPRLILVFFGLFSSLPTILSLTQVTVYTLSCWVSIRSILLTGVAQQYKRFKLTSLRLIRFKLRPATEVSKSCIIVKLEFLIEVFFCEIIVLLFLFYFFATHNELQAE